MYKVKYSIDGILKEMTVDARDVISAQSIITNMFGNGRVQIIDVRRV